MDVKMEESWKHVLKNEFSKSYFLEAVTFIKTEKALNKTIYPPGQFIFNAFNHTPFNNVKVVIIGQDPYHGKGQAHGLSFSVPDGVRPPPSLINIFKELHDDTGLPIPKGGNLIPWADHGVLLLNASLTVRDAEPNSHSKIGWTQFTDSVISIVSAEKKHVVFMLWGKYAHEKQALIDETKHLVLKAAHPSPFSAYTGFFGCKHFSQANKYLMDNGIDPVDWAI